MLLVFALILNWTGVAEAGAPCSGVRISEDEFTHQKTAEVSGRVWNMDNSKLDWTANFVGGKVTLTLNLMGPGARNEILPAGYTVKVLQEDGNVVDLATVAETAPAPNAYSDGVFTIYNAVFPLDSAVLQRLAASPLTKIRADLPFGTVDWRASNGKMARPFEQAFTCFASLVQ